MFTYIFFYVKIQCFTACSCSDTCTVLAPTRSHHREHDKRAVKKTSTHALKHRHADAETLKHHTDTRSRTRTHILHLSPSVFRVHQSSTRTALNLNAFEVVHHTLFTHKHHTTCTHTDTPNTGYNEDITVGIRTESEIKSSFVGRWAALPQLVFVPRQNIKRQSSVMTPCAKATWFREIGPRTCLL